MHGHKVLGMTPMERMPTNMKCKVQHCTACQNSAGHRRIWQLRQPCWLQSRHMRLSAVASLYHHMKRNMGSK